jgi:hypothetical protein
MTISESHASHIRRVYVAFLVEAPELDPTRVTESLGVLPDGAARRGDERRNIQGVVIGVEENGWWRLSTEGIVVSRDINDHFHHLIDQLLPYCDILLNFAKGGETFFDVHWESTYLYAGTGPLIDKQSIAAVAALGAGMGFDIYQIDELEDTDAAH